MKLSIYPLLGIISFGLISACEQRVFLALGHESTGLSRYVDFIPELDRRLEGDPIVRISREPYRDLLEGRVKLAVVPTLAIGDALARGRQPSIHWIVAQQSTGMIMDCPKDWAQAKLSLSPYDLAPRQFALATARHFNLDAAFLIGEDRPVEEATCKILVGGGDCDKATRNCVRLEHVRNSSISFVAMSLEEMKHSEYDDAKKVGETWFAVVQGVRQRLNSRVLKAPPGARAGTRETPEEVAASAQTSKLPITDDIYAVFTLDESRDMISPHATSANRPFYAAVANSLVLLGRESSYEFMMQIVDPTVHEYLDKLTKKS